MRNRDFLKELQSLSLIGLLVTAVTIVIGLSDLFTAQPIQTEMALCSVTIEHPDVQQRVLYGLTKAPEALVLLIALGLLSLVLHRARRGDPFARSTIIGLRVLGGVLWLGMIAALGEFWAQLALSESVTHDRATASMSLPAGWLFGGFVCFAVAQLACRAASMRDELATVV